MYVIVTAFGFVSLFIISALVFDITRGYLAKTQLQEFLDLAAMKGVYLLEDGKTEVEVKNYVKNLVNQNLLLSGFSESAASESANNLNVSTSVSSGTKKVHITGDVNQSLMLLNIFPEFPDFLNLSTLAEAEITSMSSGGDKTVVFVLDYSGSMTRSTACDEPDPDDCPEKREALEETLSYIVNSTGFLNNTAVGIVYYNRYAYEHYAIHASDDLDALSSHIDSLSDKTSSGTNTYEGLQLAGQLFADAIANEVIAPTTPMHVIHFTDGLPSKPNNPDFDCPGQTPPYDAFINIPPEDPNNMDYYEDKKKDTSLAIQASDNLRSAGIIVHTIALGKIWDELTEHERTTRWEGCVNPPDPNDPFEDIVCRQPIKINLLWRLSGLSSSVGLDFPCAIPTDTISPDLQGMAVRAASTDFLLDAFESLIGGIGSEVSAVRLTK